jgi:nitroimidazol reductase NimA-like FMN-containing flavoprotein (pyridoxamine 5'-phosphate oxidase superfamily)
MAGHMSWQKIDIWLQGYRSIWLSTTRPDGRPHCVPVWYWWEAEQPKLYFVTSPDTVKAKNMARQPWVVLTAGNADDTIILQGLVHPVTDEAERSAVNENWQKKYIDPYSGATATVMDAGSILYRVNIQHVMAWEYGAVVARTDWHFNEK